MVCTLRFAECRLLFYVKIPHYFKKTFNFHITIDIDRKVYYNDMSVLKRCYEERKKHWTEKFSSWRWQC